jgi:hypothetical protein
MNTKKVRSHVSRVRYEVTEYVISRPVPRYEVTEYEINLPCFFVRVAAEVEKLPKKMRAKKKLA